MGVPQKVLTRKIWGISVLTTNRSTVATRSRVRPASPPPTVNLKTLLVVADLAVVILAVAVTDTLVQFIGERVAIGAGNRFVVVAMLTLPVWPAVFSRQRLYNTRFIGRRIDEVRRIFNAIGLGVLGIALGGYFANVLVSRASLIALFPIAVILVSLEREGARYLFSRARMKGHLLRDVVIAGANPEGRDLAAMLQSEPWLGYHVVGFVDDTATDPQPVAGIPLLGPIASAADIVRSHRAASVIVAASAIESATTNRLARELLDRGVHVELSSTLRDIASQRLTVRPLGRFPVVYVEPVQRDGWRAIAKRAFDISGAVVGLTAAAPMLLVTALLIKLGDRGPVLFRQTRVGRNGTPFQVLKLRSMVVNAEAQLLDLTDRNEADGPLFKMEHDPRITKVGSFIRKTSLDEIPQLWNVLKGEMSLVGPRPALQHETEMWDPLLTQRLRVKPGITGMWQVNGRSSASFEDYTRLDLYYVDNWSLLTDLAILFKTVPVVLLRKGAV
jgi:exopolysaccharide biosynthesis polyprenyl glycosylphosphotransferase